MRLFLKKSGHWVWIFILTDVIFLFATWLIDSDSLKYMVPFLLLFSCIAVLTGVVLDKRSRKKDNAAISSFLEQPDEKAAVQLCDYYDGDQIVQTAIQEYMRIRNLVKKTGNLRTAYQEYIEAWVHEIKTPISMMELMTENHREEMTSYVYQRLRYAVCQLTEDAERILYYSRLNAEHPDFRIELFSLSECVQEKAEEYETLIREKKISLELELESSGVVSDRRITLFMLSQIMSNAVKYTDGEEGKIVISVRQNDDEVSLDICNNGSDVPPEDRPFLFDKGFTGSHPERQKATGMGLYLVKKYAEKLGISVQIDDNIPFESGFGIKLIFHL